MYAYGIDEQEGVLVSISSNPRVASDFPRSAVSMLELDQLWIKRTEMPLWLCILDPGLPAPTALERKAISDAWDQIKSPSYGFCLVTSSTLMVGVMTAISWVRPDQGRFPKVARTTLEGSVKWAEGIRGKPLPGLYEVEKRIRKQLA